MVCHFLPYLLKAVRFLSTVATFLGELPNSGRLKKRRFVDNSMWSPFEGLHLDFLFSNIQKVRNPRISDLRSLCFPRISTEHNSNAVANWAIFTWIGMFSTLFHQDILHTLSCIECESLKIQKLR